jgi:hypothetical protein
MKRSSLLSTFFCVLVGSVLVGAAAVAQPALTPICDLLEDANGDCIVDNLDQEVCVRGVVLAWKHFGDRGPGAIWDPEADCAISVFDITDAPDVAIGNLVEVCAWTGNFAGLAELVDNPDDDTMDPVVTDLGVGPAYPIIELTAAELADFSALAEQKESFLVRLCGEFLDSGDFASGTNYEFRDTLGDICEIRIDNDVDIVGTPIPAGPVGLTGILSQFNGFTDTCVGYQVLPRSLDDLVVGDCEPIATESETWSGVKERYR